MSAIFALNKWVGDRFAALVTATRRSMTTGFYEARLEERRRIARELHDRLGEVLTVGLRQLDLKEVADPKGPEGQSASAREVLVEAMRRLRVVTSGLRDEPVASLEKALTGFLNRVCADANVQLVVIGDESWASAEVIDETFLIIEKRCATPWPTERAVGSGRRRSDPPSDMRMGGRRRQGVRVRRQCEVFRRRHGSCLDAGTGSAARRELVNCQQAWSRHERRVDRSAVGAPPRIARRGAGLWHQAHGAPTGNTSPPSSSATVGGCLSLIVARRRVRSGQVNDLDAGRCSELGQDVRDMRLNGVAGQEQPRGDVGVGQALRHQLRDPRLGRRERRTTNVRTIRAARGTCRTPWARSPARPGGHATEPQAARTGAPHSPPASWPSSHPPQQPTGPRHSQGPRHTRAGGPPCWRSRPHGGLPEYPAPPAPCSDPRRLLPRQRLEPRFQRGRRRLPCGASPVSRRRAPAGRGRAQQSLIGISFPRFGSRQCASSTMASSGAPRCSATTAWPASDRAGPGPGRLHPLGCAGDNAKVPCRVIPVIAACRHQRCKRDRVYS